MRKVRNNERNRTGVVLALIFCLVSYFLITRTSPGEAVHFEPSWLPVIIPMGAFIIVLVFDRIIRVDFFRK